MKKTAALLIFSLYTHVISAEEMDKAPKMHKHQITYLSTSKEHKKALELYREYKKETGKHDFDMLSHLSQSILKEGAKSAELQTQMVSIYASSLAGVDCPCDILEIGLASSNMQTQLASLHFLARLQDDRIDFLLQKAMNSEFLYTRLEAAYLLATKKAHSATGQIEALMYKLPPQLRFFFPELFALIGSYEATHILKHLMDDPFHPIRIEAILSAARHGRDDLLPSIRSSSTHLDIAEQEACAAAIGHLKDTSSIKRLRKLSHSPAENVQLAALFALHKMGDEQAKEHIIQKANEKNCFAITLLSEIEGTQNSLYALCHDENISVRFNAAVSLLRRKDQRAIKPLLEFIIRDSRDLGFQPQSSLGGSLQTLKVISSLHQQAKQSPIDLHATTLSLRESILKEALELPENAFLDLAKAALEARQNELVPMLVSLLENLGSDAARALLRSKSQTAGAPLIRAYCTLSLCRLKEEGGYEKSLKEWIQGKFQHKIIEFRPSMPLGARLGEHSFELTPEENSSLLIESYEYLGSTHTEENIEFLLNAMIQSEPKNLPLLAGILLRSLQ